MSVGFSSDKTAIDARAGGLSTQIRDLFTQIQLFEQFLAGKQDTDLTALGYSEPEVTLLKSAFTQLDQLRQLATGQSTQATVNNFLFFSDQLCGVN